MGTRALSISSIVQTATALALATQKGNEAHFVDLLFFRRHRAPYADNAPVVPLNDVAVK
jgi:hypothetical protein